MRTRTFKQLGGACNLEFHANTFEELSEVSKKHGMEMFRLGDAAHLKAMDNMKEIMKSPEAMSKWLENMRSEFYATPESK